YFSSNFAPAEWEGAFCLDPKGEHGLLVTVRVRPCKIEGLLRRIGYIDLVGHDEKAAHDILLAKIKRERYKPKKAPAFPSSLECPIFPSDLSDGINPRDFFKLKLQNYNPVLKFLLSIFAAIILMTSISSSNAIYDRYYNSTFKNTPIVNATGTF